MVWIVIGATLAALVSLTASINSRRFARRVAREARGLWTAQARPRALDKSRIDALPTPVRNYLKKALVGQERTVAGVRFRHGGRFRSRLDGSWSRIRGEQYDTADPPGFVWWGRVGLGPGLWIDARDGCRNGIGGMLVSLESSLTLADRSGPEMDQGSLLRLLSDLVLLPTALLDDRYVTWSSVDPRRARATLRLNGREVAGVFEFGEDSLPCSFFADRYFDSGRGKARLNPWSGDYADYRKISGMLVPHRFLGYWHVEGRPIPYVDFQLEPPEYDEHRPFDAGTQ